MKPNEGRLCTLMKKRLIIMVVSVFVLALPPAGPAVAGLDEIRRGAELGDAQMQLELGELYEYGFGLPKNLVPALAWYILAAEQGNTQAIKRRDVLQGRLTRQQVEEAERNAAHWRKRPAAADAGEGRNKAVNAEKEPAPLPAPAPGQGKDLPLEPGTQR